MSERKRDAAFLPLVQMVLEKQAFMRLLGVRCDAVSKGQCSLALDVRPDLTQHGGVVHGGVLGALADNAAGGAASTMAPEGHAAVTAEYKISFLSPAMGQTLRADGLVLKAGRTLISAESRVYAVNADGGETLCAVALATMVPVAMPGAMPARG